MALSPQDYAQFVERGAGILVVGPDRRCSFQELRYREGLPLVGLADPAHTLVGQYGQDVKPLRLGRLPALMVLDKAGLVRYSHYGGSMQGIPPNGEVLSILERLTSEEVTG